MKTRVFMDMIDGVFRATVFTEDWSEGDVSLMVQFGEPDVNVGGKVAYSYGGEEREKEFGDLFVRVLHGFPNARMFDSRDYGSVGEAKAAGCAWKDLVVGRIAGAVSSLRENVSVLPTEEVSEL